MTTLHSDIESKMLFDAIALGDEVVFKNLFELYKSKMYAVAFKWTKSSFAAEEITQEVFISIWIGRERLVAIKDPEAYLYTIVYNKVSRYLKREASQAHILKHWETKNFTNETEEMIFGNDSEKFISTAIEQLSSQKKLIYKLNRHYGKSYDEIGEALHLSRHTVKSHLMKAVKFIRNYMKEHALVTLLFIVRLFF
jgi:RNA polymerase sigma-70 factor (family 1)